MANTFKLILIVLTINLLIGVGISAYETTTQHQATATDITNTYTDYMTDRLTLNYRDTQSASTDQEAQTVIDDLDTQMNFLDILWNGIKLVPIPENNTLETIIAIIINMFRIILGGLLVVQAYILFRNKAVE